MKVSDLIPDDKNANRGTKRGAEAVQASLKELGAGRSILIDRDGRVIAGNKTIAAAVAAGVEEVIVVESDGTKIIAVKRTDLSLDDAKGRKLAVADNRTAELGLEWDSAVLKEFDPADLKPFFTDNELSIALGNAPDTGSMTQQIDLAYRVVVECDSEQHQIEVLTELEAKGLKCQLLIS
jgi:hypothetical protein